MRTALLPSLSLVLLCCKPRPVTYEIPPQHLPPSVIAELAEPDVIVHANDPDAGRYFVRDVRALEGTGWRWTLAEPEFQFTLISPARKSFEMKFVVHDGAIHDVGPLKLVFFVNEHELDRVTYDAFGNQFFRKDVPDEWLRSGLNTVRVRVLNPWQSPEPGVKLGVIFVSAGFVSR